MDPSVEPPVFSVCLEQGIKLPRIFPAEPNPYEQLNLYPSDNDVILCSYPASGEETLLKILKCLITESSSPTTPSTSGGGDKKVHVTHLPFCNSRWNPNSRYVLLLRNPKQVCVSFFYLFNNLFRMMYDRQPEENCSFNTFYRLFVRGKVAFGDYFLHTKSWLDRRCPTGCYCESGSAIDESENLLIVIYEDLETDLEHNARRLAQFMKLDLELSSDLKKKLSQIVGNNENFDSVDHGKKKKMGLAGGWESHFSKEHRICFDEWVRWNGNARIYNKFWFDAL